MIQNILFDGILPEEQQELFKCLQPVQKIYEKEETIWQEGQMVETIGLVQSGKVLLIRDDFWGNRSILAEAVAGDIFGESYACVPTQPCMVSVIAQERTKVLFVKIAQTLSVCQQVCGFHTRLIQNLMQILAQKNIALSRKIDHLTRRTTRQKILAYLSYQAQVHGTATFEIPFNRQEFADYLSVDRSALSQELSRMRQDGLIDFKRSRFVLHEIKGEHV